MPKTQFTTRGLAALLSRSRKDRADHWDASMPGLCLRVGPKAATWYYFRRVDGKLLRLTIGKHSELATGGRASFTVAREKAGEIESAIAAGKHPKAEQARKRAAQSESRQIDNARLVENAAEAWSKAHFKTLADATKADYQRALDEFVKAFKGEDIGALTRGQIIRHLDKIKARSPMAANRAAVVIRQLFAFCRDRYDLPANPVVDLKNPAKQPKRKRVLGRDEIRVLWEACEQAGYPYGHALRLALCTGQRIGEVGAIKRTDIEGDYWQQTDNKSKQRIDLCLGKHARAILDDCPVFEDSAGKPLPYFLSASDGRKGLRSDTWNNAIARHIAPKIPEAAEELDLPDLKEHWTPHDLRRTVRTGLTGWCGVSPDNAERVLNHSIGGLRAVYDFADYRPHVADALSRWDAELSAILKGKQPTIAKLSDRRKRRA